MADELKRTVRDAADGWRARPQVAFKNVVSELVDRGFLKEVVLRSDHYRDLKRYAVPSKSPHAVHYAASVRGGAYLSHASAVYLLGLGEQVVRNWYVNKEQSPKPAPAGPLTQESIDRAFARKQRQSRYTLRVDDIRITLLSGKSTRNAGVRVHEDLGVLYTGLERTLIDIAVRPKYAGGVFQVARAYAAAPDLSVEELVALLQRLDYRYPYHQAIGFYLSRAGYSESQLAPLRELGLHHDFYLDYNMIGAELDPLWRVHVPRGV